MSNRRELIEAALEGLPDGIALLDSGGQVHFWNRAAEEITGFASVEIVARPLPGALEPLVPSIAEIALPLGPRREPAVPVHVQHRTGRDLRLVARTVVLRDQLSDRIGYSVVFHCAEGCGVLPRGEFSPFSNLEAEQLTAKERVEEIFAECTERGVAFGVLWIMVDQASELRKTHGARACESMLQRVEQTLSNGLRPAEEIGRWGDGEFLVLAQEPEAERLAEHAQMLAGLARFTRFRWWGDRVPLTVSIGAAQLEPAESLVELLERAQAAMLSSLHAGGNCMTLAPGRQPCSPS